MTAPETGREPATEPDPLTPVPGGRRGGCLTSGVAMGVFLSIGVLLLVVIASTVTGVFVYDKVSADRDAVVAARDRQLAELDRERKIVYAEYVRQTCAITAALPKPLPADVVHVRTLLRCPPVD